MDFKIILFALSTIPSGLAGTWEWRSGSDVFRLVLERDPTFHLPDGQTYDVLLGRHSYTRKGVVVEQSLTLAGQDGNPGFTLFGIPGNSEPFSMSFSDLSKHKLGRVTLEPLATHPDQLHWQLAPPSETISINKPIPPGFTVPRDLVLTRVK